jgi:hypothetical protein
VPELKNDVPPPTPGFDNPPIVGVVVGLKNVPLVFGLLNKELVPPVDVLENKPVPDGLLPVMKFGLFCVVPKVELVDVKLNADIGLLFFVGL